ncbi:MAG: DUF2786 domain-containing protein [Pseudomonadota bacterium]
MTSSINMSDEIERLWVAQLYKEHQEISWYHRAGLTPVVIQLSDMTSAWGKWDPFFRTITLSRRLITGHSWDVVLEILKHEMAHQYVSERLGGISDTAHGGSFKTACLKLGVASWAARATGEIPEVIPTLRERVLSKEDERLLDRVEKLLSLAQSSNEHEALLAMERVRELYLKHNLVKIKLSVSGDSMDSLFLTRRKKKTDPTEVKILSILNNHFRVKVVHTHLYDAKACERHKAAEIIGRRENILMAEFVYHFLSQQCESLWAQHKKATRCPGILRRSYQLGVLSGFDQKLSLSRPISEVTLAGTGITMSEVSALQRVASNELDDFLSARYPRISKKSWVGGRVDSGTFASGQTAGRSLNLNKPVTGTSRFGGYLG